MSSHSDLSDRAIARIRTAVPALWGSIVAALLTVVGPHLRVDVVDALGGWLGGEAAIGLVTTAAILAWYWAWQRLSPRVPDWLVRLALGSPATPTYAPVVDDVAQVTALTSEERTNLGSLATALEPGDPGRVALERFLHF